MCVYSISLSLPMKNRSRGQVATNPPVVLISNSSTSPRKKVQFVGLASCSAVYY